MHRTVSADKKTETARKAAQNLSVEISMIAPDYTKY